jgi:molybdopterin-guanine dinucleotide biosynthesis protein A
MQDITITILAGGQSRRMRRDKAFVPLAGKPMLQHIIDAVSTLKCPIRLIANDHNRYSIFGLPVHADLMPGTGALGGIYTAMMTCQTPSVLCLACDMPFVDPAVLRFLIAQRTHAADVIIPQVDASLQPLHAIYHRNVIPMLEKQLARASLAIHDFLALVEILTVPQAVLHAAGFDTRSFINLNTPEDLERAKTITDSF